MSENVLIARITFLSLIKELLKFSGKTDGDSICICLNHHG